MRRYSNNAVQTTLSGAVTAVATTITVSSTTGFPAADFVLALDYGTASQELVLVTGVGGTTLTVTRGYDNTTAVSHEVGAVVVHTHSAADFADSRNHEAATGNVHGVVGDVVGTTDAQALSHKDLSDATNTFPASVVTTTGAQVITDKDLTDATNTFPSSLATDAEVQTVSDNLSNHEAATAAHGVVTQIVGIGETQTLTNKDLSSSSNTFPGTLLKANASGLLVRSGTLTLSLSGQPYVSGPVSFGNAYASSPVVLVSGEHNFTTVQFEVNAISVTVNGFSARVADSQGVSRTGSVTVHWVAIGVA